MKTQGLAKAGMAVGLALVLGACAPSAATLLEKSGLLETVGDAHASDPGLVGSWQLASLTENGKPPVEVTEPARFTAEFRAEGVISLRADCNRCLGTYKTNGEALTVGPMACQRAYCPSAPLDTTFAQLVSRSTAWTATQDGLELRSDAGQLRLKR
jgi:heat shock protein HslJ